MRFCSIALSDVEVTPIMGLCSLWKKAHKVQGPNTSDVTLSATDIITSEHKVFAVIHILRSRCGIFWITILDTPYRSVK